MATVAGHSGLAHRCWQGYEAGKREWFHSPKRSGAMGLENRFFSHAERCKRFSQGVVQVNVLESEYVTCVCFAWGRWPILKMIGLESSNFCQYSVFMHILSPSRFSSDLPLAWTSFSVASPTICMQRRDKRDSNVSRSASQMRLRRSLGFLTCLFIASPLSGRTSGAQWHQVRSNFSPWTTQPLHEKLFMGFRRAKVSQRNTNCQKMFLGTIDSGVTTRRP